MAKATKAAREFAAENNVDLETVKGTGSGGQITKEDVVNASESEKASIDEPQQERVGATQAENAENVKNRNAASSAQTAGEALRSQLTTTTADMRDSRLKQGAAVARGGRDLAGGPDKGVIGQASSLIQRVAAPSEGGNMAEELSLVFNPSSGTSRVLYEGENFEPGDLVSPEKFEELKHLTSDGVPIFDEEATTGQPSEQEGEHPHAGAESSDEDEPDQADASDAEESTSSADENKET